jgi:glycosyltransferase involved in cell wall biosynthesis
MTHMPEISVIIPCYNHAPYLVQRIESVLAQTFTDYELILLDDFSKDDSRIILERYCQHPSVSHVVFNTNNSGSPFGQWEKGLQLAQGKWVWIAETDDYAEPDFLEVLYNNALKHENVGISFSSSFWIDDQNVKGEERNYHKQSFFREGLQEVHDTLCRDCSIQNVSAALIRRDVALECIGGLHTYRACGDWIFYTRVLQRSNLVYDERKLNYFRWYHDNTSNKAYKMGLWVSEGMNVLFNIDYSKVRYTWKEAVALHKFWRWRVIHTKPNRWKNLLKFASFNAMIFLNTIRYPSKKA